MLTCDGGGTSTDVTVVIDGEPTLTTEGSVGDYPSKIPMIDVVTVGAGGGSIAWLSPEGTLKVGPKSAGADPGPMCYPNGGDQPTVTDAHVTLGRIPPHLLGGEIPLSVDAASDGLSQLGAKLDLSLERTATGILEISAWNQANALRQVTVAKGLDVRDFTLTTFGGSGSLLACRLMDILNLPRTLVPPNPGNVSAFGLLTVDVRNDYVQTVVSKHARPRPRPGAVGLRRPGGARPRSALDGEGFGRDEQRMQRTADLRYVGQAFEVRVPGRATASSTAARAEDVAQAFHAAHRQLYGYDFADRPAPGRRVGQPPGQRDRADPPSRHRGAAREGRRDGPGRHRLPPGLLRRLGRHPDLQPARPRARVTWSPARRSSRSSAPPSRCTPASPSPSTPTATCCSRRSPASDRPARRSTPTRSSSRSSPARWPRSRRRSRPPSGARRARR